MNFWEIVAEELNYRGIPRKQLASEAGFDASNIGKGIKNGNSPSVETAVKIASVLGVPVEYLVTGKDSSIPSFLKKDVIDIAIKLNRLDDRDIQFVKDLVDRLSVKN